MKFVIIGSSSTLGGKLMEKFSPKYKTLGTYYNTEQGIRTLKNAVYLDVSKEILLEKFLLDFKPSCVIYAANVNARTADSKPELSEQVNLQGLKSVANICTSLDVKLVYLSSDRVFEGAGNGTYREESPTSPNSVFANHKFEAEDYIKKHIPNHIILRTSMLYGYSVQSELRGHIGPILEKLEAGDVVTLDNTTKRFPTLSDDVFEYLEKLLLADEVGTFHICPEQGYTHFEIGKLVAQAFGHSESLVSEANQAEPLPSIHLGNDETRHLPETITSFADGLQMVRKQAGCAFKMIYSLRPDMLIADQNANDFRIKAGHKLAEETPLPKNVDFVVPIPESGIYSATGVAAGNGKPIYFGIIRDYFTEKTLYSSTLQNRYENLKRKLIPVKEILEGKSIGLVDEAVLSGSTLKVVISMLKEVGVKEIHVRIPSPPMAKYCTAKVLPSLKLACHEIFEKENAEAELKKHFEVDSFAFLSTDGFKSIPNSPEKMCFDCFMQ